MSKPSNANAIAEVASKFNKLYIFPPNRPTRIKKAMNIAFHRGGDEKRVNPDFLSRIAERNPRHEDMSDTQNWTNVWPAAQSFRASVVPLPVRMGFRRRPERYPPKGAYGNLELMKIPNFLHLTPQHIQQHTNAIKKFCTKFPEELKQAAVQEQYTPLRLVYSDYLHQGTNIRDMRARKVTAHVRLNSLGLQANDGVNLSLFNFDDIWDTHAHNKCRQLVGDRYDGETDVITISSEKCPLRQQNLDYVSYLLTALFHESHRTEPWEENMIQEVLADKEQERMNAEGEPESEQQAQLMMRRD